MLSITNTVLNIFDKPGVADFAEKNILSKYDRPVHAFFHRSGERIVPNVVEFNDKLFGLVCDAWEKRDLTPEEMLRLGFRGACLSNGVTFYVGSMKD